MKHEREIGHLHYQIVFDLCVRYKQWQAMVISIPDTSKPDGAETIWGSLSYSTMKDAVAAYSAWVNSPECPDEFKIRVAGMYGDYDGT